MGLGGSRMKYLVKKLKHTAVLFSMLFLAVGCTKQSDESDRIIQKDQQITALKQEIARLKEDIKELQSQQQEVKEMPPINEQNEDLQVQQPLAMRILTAEGKMLQYVLMPSDEVNARVNVIGEGAVGLQEKFEVIYLDGQEEGKEILQFEVLGSIYNFQHVTIKWDEETSDFVEATILNEFKEVSNKNIRIKTTLSCGMPNEKVKWEDSKGNKYQVFLAEDGYGFDGSIIWSIDQQADSILR